MSFSQEKFKFEYQKGIFAFEQGRYRISIEHLEQATLLVSAHSRLGGEVKIWLVNAYQAMGDSQKAIALCQELLSHPHGETKRQAQKLLYIIQAPQLKRPREWMIEIPDLNSGLENNDRYKPVIKNQKKPQPKRQIELVDLSQVNNQDNNFIFITLFFACLTLVGLLII